MHETRMIVGFRLVGAARLASPSSLTSFDSVRTRDLLNPIQAAQHAYTSIHFSTHRFGRFDLRTLPYTPAHLVTARRDRSFRQSAGASLAAPLLRVISFLPPREIPELTP